MNTLRRLFLVAALAVAGPILGQQIVGNLTVQQFVRNADGTAAAPSYRFTNSPTTGLIRSSADSLGIVTAGVERWVFNSSGSFVPLINNTYDIGNGVVNPRDIHIARNIIIGGVTSTAALDITKASTYNSEGTAALAITTTTATDSKLVMGADAANDITYIQSMQAGTSYGTRPLWIMPNGGSTVIGLVATPVTITETGNITAAGDLTVSGGNVGVGGAASAFIGIHLRSSVLTGSSQYGFANVPVFSAAAISEGIVTFSHVNTVAAAFTQVASYAIYAQTPTLGAGSAITTNTGLYVANQGASGITNAIGIDIAAQSGAATNVGLRNAGTTILGSAGNQIVAVYTGTATLNFGIILAAALEDLTITVTGAAVNDVVTFGPPATMLAGAVFNAWVTSANTVTVRCNNAGSITIDPASATYRATVMSH